MLPFMTCTLRNFTSQNSICTEGEGRGFWCISDIRKRMNSTISSLDTNMCTHAHLQTHTTLATSVYYFGVNIPVRLLETEGGKIKKLNIKGY